MQEKSTVANKLELSLFRRPWILRWVLFLRAAEPLNVNKGVNQVWIYKDIPFSVQLYFSGFWIWLMFNVAFKHNMYIMLLIFFCWNLINECVKTLRDIFYSSALKEIFWGYFPKSVIKTNKLWITILIFFYFYWFWISTFTLLNISNLDF